MTAALDKKDLGHIHDVLSPDPLVKSAELRTLSMIAEQAGEVVIYPTKMKQPSVMMLRGLVDKGLITAEVVSELELTQRTRLRLTDHGRKVASYNEAMKANPVKQAESLSLEQLESIAGVPSST